MGEETEGEILGAGETSGERTRAATMSAHWDCLSETFGAGATGSGAESELGVATQQGPPQAQRVQQAGAFVPAASTGRTPCVSATSALNKIPKAAFTIPIR